MVGAAILMAVLAAMLLAMVSQGSLRRTTHEQDLAQAACRNNLESMRELPFSSLMTLHNSGFDVPDEAGAPGVLHAVDGDPDGLPGQILVTTADSQDGETLYLVRLVVTWAGINGRQEIEARSLVSDRKKT